MPMQHFPRVARFATGIAAAAVLVAAPVSAAQAADTDAVGTLTAGALSNTAPPIAPFGVTLTGVNQTVTTAVGASDVIDATGSGAGYSITVAASAPAVAGGTAGTGGSLTLTPKAPTAAPGNPATTGAVVSGPQALSTTAATIANAAPGTGEGQWDFAADAGAEASLSVVVPGNASAGTYSSTLTYTTAPPVA